MIDSIPRFMSGAFAFQGAGYDKPKLLDPSLVYTVPADKRAQLIYLRVGNSSPELAFVSIMQGDKAIIRLLNQVLTNVDEPAGGGRLRTRASAPQGCR